MSPGAGLFVRSFSFSPILDNLFYGLMFDIKEFADIVEVRAILEHGITEQVIEAVTPEQLECVDQVLKQMNQDTAEGR